MIALYLLAACGAGTFLLVAAFLLWFCWFNWSLDRQDRQTHTKIIYLKHVDRR
jgi:hypothetical protein